MGKKGEPVTTYKKPQSSSNVIVNPVESDEFNAPVIGKQWAWHANYDEKFGVPTAFGTMRIYTYKMSDVRSQKEDVHSAVSPQPSNLWLVPNLFLQKTPADEFTVTAKIRFTSKADGQMGGLIMMGHNYQALVVKRVGKEFQLLVLSCEDADRGKAQKEELIATLKPTAPRIR